MVGETTQMRFRVVLTTSKLIVVHAEIYGGEFQLEEFTLRYEGFSLCGIIGADGKLAEVPQLALADKTKHQKIASIAQEVVNNQKWTLKELDEWRT